MTPDIITLDFCSLKGLKLDWERRSFFQIRVSNLEKVGQSTALNTLTFCSTIDSIDNYHQTSNMIIPLLTIQRTRSGYITYEQFFLFNLFFSYYIHVFNFLTGQVLLKITT